MHHEHHTALAARHAQVPLRAVERQQRIFDCAFPFHTYQLAHPRPRFRQVVLHPPLRPLYGLHSSAQLFPNPQLLHPFSSVCFATIISRRGDPHASLHFWVTGKNRKTTVPFAARALTAPSLLRFPHPGHFWTVTNSVTGVTCTTQPHGCYGRYIDGLSPMSPLGDALQTIC
jgi:hypothetical protein